MGYLHNLMLKQFSNLQLKVSEIISEKEFDAIVLYTKNDAIKAKTAGQTNYIQTANKNDICFAIGPAGTGKTYLAVALAVVSIKKRSCK